MGYQASNPQGRKDTAGGRMFHITLHVWGNIKLIKEDFFGSVEVLEELFAELFSSEALFSAFASCIFLNMSIKEPSFANVLTTDGSCLRGLRLLLRRGLRLRLEGL